MSNNAFSEHLRTLRGTRTKAEFARFLGITAPSYQKYEDGMVPRADCLCAMAERLEVPANWLLTGNGAPPATGTPVPPPVMTADQPLATPATCRYPAECDLVRELALLNERQDRMGSKLDTLCELLSVALGKGLEDRVKRKAG